MQRLSVWFVGLFLAMLSAVAAAEAPKVGEAAPAFTLPDQSGQAHSLSEYRGKWMVLYFYPKDGTPGCTTEACSFRDAYLQIKALGAQVLGISVDDTASHLAFATKHSLPFPLLADNDGKVAALYGALNDLKLVKFAHRETFLVDPQGIVRKAYPKVDPDKHAAEVTADLKQLQGLIGGSNASSI